ncbi:hypothetical protein BT93_J0219 [Corymbia citriodora subsp. variegata]|nr:hypothetical protein BT93_J0219 [Corymbia citriodora subsp. variegata]
MKETLGGMCDKRAWMLKNQFTAHVNLIHALAMVARFYYKQNATHTEQMREALETYMDNTRKRPLFSGVAFAERVGHCKLNNFEMGRKWRIMDMTFINPASPVLAPSCFCIADFAHVNALFNSLGMMTREEDQDHVLNGRAIEKAVLSGPFRLSQSNRIGVILTYPVYRSTLSPSMGLEEHTGATAGYIGGLFEFESFGENVLQQLGNQTVSVNIYDITNSSRSLLYGHNYVKSESDRPMMQERKLELEDPFRKYLKICRYRDAASLSWIPAIITVLVVTIGFLAPFLLYTMAIHKLNIREASHRIRGLEVQLQDANTANSQLRADASEIKQPACTVISTLAMLLETELSAIQRAYIRIAQACGKRQIALVDKALESPNLPVMTHAT